MIVLIVLVFLQSVHCAPCLFPSAYRDRLQLPMTLNVRSVKISEDLQHSLLATAQINMDVFSER